jgi:hypothetical protein
MMREVANASANGRWVLVASPGVAGGMIVRGRSGERVEQIMKTGQGIMLAGVSATAVVETLFSPASATIRPKQPARAHNREAVGHGQR